MPEGDQIVETLPESLVRRSFWTHIFVNWSPIAFFLFSILLVSASSQDVRADLHPSVSLLAAFALASILSTLTAIFIATIGHIEHSRIRASIPTVKFCDGQLSVVYGDACLMSDIHDCRIRRRGPLWRMMLTWKSFNPRAAKRRRGVRLWSWRPVILIDLPRFGRAPLGSIVSMNTVAVGFTDDTLEIWDRVLGTHALDDDLNWRTWLGDIMMAASWAAPGDGRANFDINPPQTAENQT